MCVLSEIQEKYASYVTSGACGKAAVQESTLHQEVHAFTVTVAEM